MRIGIIGGSIAGLAVANVLHQLGIEFKLFERSKHALSDRGAGIILPEGLFEQAISTNLISASLANLPISSRAFYSKNNQALFKQPFPALALNWSSLFLDLLNKLPADCYLKGQNICQVQQMNESVVVTTDSHANHIFDYIIAADGFDSAVCKTILPNHVAQYVGYIAWRGTIPMSEVSDKSLFHQHIPYFVYPNGHGLFYKIPGAKFNQSGEEILNWLMYQKMSHSEINHAHSIPPDQLPEQMRVHMKQFAQGVLPSHIAQLICRTQKPFLQAIYDKLIPQLRHKRICVVGDASAVLRPHTASGVAKALTQAMSLKSVFESKDLAQVEKGLEQWDREQCSTLNQQFDLSKTMGNALVTNTPDWDNMTPESMESWWQQIISGKTWYTSAEDAPLSSM